MAKGYKVSPRDEAKERILAYIKEHALTSHHRLPSERDLCELWGYNRMTLRSAIQSLIVEGVLYIKKGSGTYVAPDKLLRDLQDLRALSAVVRDSGRTLRTEVLSFEVIEGYKQVCQKLQLTLGSPVLELVRLRLIDEVPAMIETTYLDASRFNALLDKAFSTSSLYEILEIDFGLTPQTGQEKISITEASEREAEVLSIEPCAPLFYLSGVVKDQYDMPLEYFKTVARNDQVRFASRLVRQ